MLRAGYGIFYQQHDRYGSESQLALNPPQLTDVNLSAASGAVAPAMILRNGFVPIGAANVNKAALQWRIQDANQRTPTVHQFSAGVEYQLGPAMVADIEYVGNRTRHARKLRNLNQGIIGPGGIVTFRTRSMASARRSSSRSAPTAGVTTTRCRCSCSAGSATGSPSPTSFTYSSAKGNFLDILSAGGGATGAFPLNRYDIGADYGPLAFDIPKRFVTSFIYELPVGQSHALNPGGIAGAILRDWSVNGILTLSDGRPFSVGATDRAGTGSGRTIRANCIADPVPNGFDQTIDHWMDINAFAPLEVGTYGNCGYNNVRGPGFKSMNASLFRSFPMGDRRLEFRIETFNLFNNVNFNLPAANVNTPASFGKITGTIGNPREMQFGLKFYF